MTIKHKLARNWQKCVYIDKFVSFIHFILIKTEMYKSNFIYIPSI